MPLYIYRICSDPLSPVSLLLSLSDLALATRHASPGLARVTVEWIRGVCDDVAANNQLVLQQCSFAGGGILPFLVLLNTTHDVDNYSSHSHSHSHNNNNNNNNSGFASTSASAGASASVSTGTGTIAGAGNTPTHRLQRASARLLRQLVTGTSGDVMAIPLHAPSTMTATHPHNHMSTTTSNPYSNMSTTSTHPHPHSTIPTTIHPYPSATHQPYQLSTPSGFTAPALAALLCSAHAAHRQYIGRSPLPPPHLAITLLNFYFVSYHNFALTYHCQLISYFTISISINIAHPLLYHPSIKLSLPFFF